MKSLKIIGLIALAASVSHPNAFAQDENTAVIYMDSTEQTITGFGAAGIVGWRPNLTIDELETAYNDLGFTILRLRIPPQENHKADQSAWNANLEVAVAAHNMGFILIASPWTPPASMKTNNNLVGGRLSDDAYDDFAEYLHDFGTYMAENGAPVYAVSVQNEPDIEVSYESCDYTPEEMLTFMRDYADAITSTKVMAPESFQYRKNMSDPILMDSAATANTDMIAGHIYGGGNTQYPLAKEKGKDMWMTEYLIGNESSANLWDIAELGGRVLHTSMEANMNAYIWWYMVRFYSVLHDGTDPIDDRFNDTASKGSVTKLGYVTANYSKFVRPGYQRVYTFGPVGRGIEPLHITAYKDTATSKMVIVALNDTDNEREVGLLVDGAFPQAFTPYQTSNNQNLEQLDNIAVTGDTVFVTLPAHSITSYVSDFSLVSNENDDLTPEAYRLDQNYPNPFNPSTNISYTIPEASDVTLKVFDLLGREVATLVNSRMAAGDHSFSFDASNLSSGVYIYQLRTNNYISTKKMMLIK
jgi:glucuronoarabinoxylan endo-1,4-beta-xylanase